MSSDDPERKAKAETWRLQEIIEHIDLAMHIISDRDRDALRSDRKAVLAVERCVQIVTEAVIQIGEERMTQIAPDQPWHAIRVMGNRLRHEYWNMDLAVIYDTVNGDFPPLRQACATALSSHLTQKPDSGLDLSHDR